MAAGPKLADVASDVARLKEVVEGSATRFDGIEANIGALTRSLDSLIARFDRLSSSDPVATVVSSPSSSIATSTPPPPQSSAPVHRSVKLDFPSLTVRNLFTGFFVLSNFLLIIRLSMINASLLHR